MRVCAASTASGSWPAAMGHRLLLLVSAATDRQRLRVLRVATPAGSVRCAAFVGVLRELAAQSDERLRAT